MRPGTFASLQVPGEIAVAEPTRRYVALLRGINVGGHGIIKMADLKKLFESFGLTDVVTYIQSGNVLFRTEESDPARLALQLEKHGVFDRERYQSPRAYPRGARESRR